MVLERGFWEDFEMELAAGPPCTFLLLFIPFHSKYAASFQQE